MTQGKGSSGVRANRLQWKVIQHWIEFSIFLLEWRKKFKFSFLPDRNGKFIISMVDRAHGIAPNRIYWMERQTRAAKFCKEKRGSARWMSVSVFSVHTAYIRTVIQKHPFSGSNYISNVSRGIRQKKK